MHNAWLHAKTAVIDGVWSTVGSTNLDYWSLSSDDEVNAVILSHEFAVEMEKMFARDLAMGQVEKKGLYGKRSRRRLPTCFPIGKNAAWFITVRVAQVNQKRAHGSAPFLVN